MLHILSRFKNVQGRTAQKQVFRVRHVNFSFTLHEIQPTVEPSLSLQQHFIRGIRSRGLSQKGQASGHFQSEKWRAPYPMGSLRLKSHLHYRAYQLWSRGAKED